MIRSLRCASAIVACLALAGPWRALADPVGYYGNTLLIDRVTGQGRMLYRPDHTMTLVTLQNSPFKGKIFTGTWQIRGGKLCIAPGGEMAPFCVADDPTHKVGDHWAVMSPDGQHENLTLIAGVHP